MESRPAPLDPEHRRIPLLPATRLGWWAVALALVYVVGMSAWALVPRGAALGLLAGVAGGVVALTALRRGERAVAVYASVLPLAFAAIFLLAELLVPH